MQKEKARSIQLMDKLEEIAKSLEEGNIVAISGDDIVSGEQEQFVFLEKEENVLFVAERIHNALRETWEQTATPLKREPLVVALANALIKPYHTPEWRVDWSWENVTKDDIPIIFPAEEFYLGYPKTDYLYLASAKTNMESFARWVRVILSRLRKKGK